MADATQNDQVVAVIVPFPAQGHLNQLFQLSRIISSFNIPIHYVGSAVHNRQIKLRLHAEVNPPTAPQPIHFHDLPFSSFESPSPDPHASIQFPLHLESAFFASSSLREPIAELLRALSARSRRVVVINDSLMAATVQDIGSIPNGESYTFRSPSAFMVYSFSQDLSDLKKQLSDDDVPSDEGCFSREFFNFVAAQYQFIGLSSGNLYNTSRVVEGTYIDLLIKEGYGGSTNHWAIGPLNLVNNKAKDSKSKHKCLEWLDKQLQSSVIYVSFGTTTTLSDEQIKEIAYGLEQSKQKFIWVLRDADKGDIFQDEARKLGLPEGYEETVKENGIVVRDWAPQLEILGHPSTGGFMSHCGWNSCMEGISMGVPFATWPMHSDQPKNAFLVTKLLRIGVVVKEWAHRDKLITSTAIEQAVKVLLASTEGNDMRRRAADLGSAVRRSMDEGGDSWTEWNSFINHITR